MMSGANFFKENNFLVGVSIDGPQEFHDEYRRNRQGLPSFYKVMKGIELLKKHGVEYNAMAVVNDYNVDYPLEFYNSSRNWIAVSSNSPRSWSVSAGTRKAPSYLLPRSKTQRSS